MLLGCSSGPNDSLESRQEVTGSLSPPSPGAPELDDGGDHGSDQPWVACSKRKHQRGASVFGPVISHGVREAPGFRRHRFDARAWRSFRQASLQGHPEWPTFFLSNIELPSASPDIVEVEELIESAIDLAGRQSPANVVVVERRELTEAGATRRMWTAGFFHDDVRVSPAECDLSVESGQSSGASLYCRVPLEAPTRFEPFQIAEDTALAIARNLAEIPVGYGSVDRLYAAEGPIAGAHHYVVVSDGRREIMVDLDGRGEILASGDNTKPFTFNGYDLDYTTGVAPRDTAIPVGAEQQMLDTAPLEAGKQNCVNPTPVSPVQYQRGFAICRNDILASFDGGLEQPLVKPRLDLDYTNPADSSFDPLPPQVLAFNDTFGGVPVHENRKDVTSRPTNSGLLEQYKRTGEPSPVKAVGPAHHAELQAFYNMAKLQRFYALIDPKFVVGGQDRFRTEVTVHWNPAFDGPAAAGLDFRAGRHVVKFASVANPADGSVLYDGIGMGDIFAHEYHHHIQESLAKFAGWKQVGNDGLFPFPPASGPCTKECRRVHLLEGAADGFAAIAVDRGVMGTLFSADKSLPSLLGVCNNRNNFQSGQGVLGGRARALCNNEVFGWLQNPVPGVCQSANQYEFGSRQLILGGAVYLYQQRFREAGIGPGFYAQHLLQAERKLKNATDNEIFYLGGLLAFLSSQPSESARRYVHIARAAFAEKGVFPALAHIISAETLEDIDDRPELVCDTAICTQNKALAMSAASITAGGPLEWNGGPPPTFELFAPTGSRFENSGGKSIVYLELSETASFTSVVRTQALQVDWFSRVNCAPAGFARLPPSNANWQAVVDAADQGAGRVYYRLRQCLASDPANCVVSADTQTPAFIEVSAGAGGACNCRAAGMPSQRSPWALVAFVLGAAALLRRRRN